MRLTQLHIPSIALLGLHISKEQISLLKNVRSLLLMLDGDQPGRIATKRIAGLLQNYANVYCIYLENNLDPDDYSDSELLTVILRATNCVF